MGLIFKTALFSAFLLAFVGFIVCQQQDGNSNIQATNPTAPFPNNNSNDNNEQKSPPTIIQSAQTTEQEKNAQHMQENQQSISASRSNPGADFEKAQQSKLPTSPLDRTDREMESQNFSNSSSAVTGSSARTFDGWTDCVGSDGGKYGTCKNDVECKKKKGIPDGSCMSGMGVCCVMALTCGDKSHDNNTFFANVDYPEPSWEARLCEVEIKPKKQKTLQIMIEFEEFELAPPNAYGECITDVFQIKLASGRPSPYSLLRICGQNTGQHMYLDVSQLDHDEALILSVATSGGGFPRRWSIRIVHLDEKNYLLAPPGCLQYYTDTVGHFRSFNLGKNLRNLYYAICFRIDHGYSGIRFTDNFFGMNGPICHKKGPVPKGPPRLPPPYPGHPGGFKGPNPYPPQPKGTYSQPQQQTSYSQPQSSYSGPSRFKRYADDETKKPIPESQILTMPRPGQEVEKKNPSSSEPTMNEQQTQSGDKTESVARTWSHEEKEDKKEYKHHMKHHQYGDEYPQYPQQYGMPGSYGSGYGGGGYGHPGYGPHHQPGYGHPGMYEHHGKFDHKAGKFDEHKYEKYDKYDDKEYKKEEKKGWWPSWGKKEEKKYKKEKYSEHHEAMFPYVRMFALPPCEPKFCGQNDVITFPPSGESIAEMCGNSFNRGRGPKIISGSPLVVYVSNRGTQRGSGFDMNYEQVFYLPKPY